MIFLSKPTTAVRVVGLSGQLRPIWRLAAVRKQDKVRFGIRRRVPSEIRTVFVPCSNGRDGRHPVTVALWYAPAHAKTNDASVVSMGCGCSRAPANVIDAVMRLGGEVCVKDLRQVAESSNVYSNTSAPTGRIDLGWRLKASHSRVRQDRQETGPYTPPIRSEQQKWQDRYTAAAQRVAGRGFEGLRIELNDDRSLQMMFGSTKVAYRTPQGAWQFDELQLLEQVQYSSGNSLISKHAGKTHHGHCFVCDQDLANLTAHVRKTKHAAAVVKGIKRAMYRLRKPTNSPKGG